MKYKRLNKKFLYIGIVIILSAVIVAVSASVGSGEKGVQVYDSDGVMIATLSYRNKKIRTELLNEDAREYVALATEEALKRYSESEEEADEKQFFSTVKVIKTNLNTDILTKIKEGYNASDINKTASFSSVITDIEGRVLAAYGKGDDGDEIYSSQKNYAGSSIKPLSVYAPIIQRGKANWSSMVVDSPIRKWSETKGVYEEWPTNAGRSYTNKNMLLCDAVYKSINTVAVKLLLELTAEKSMDFLERNLGIEISHERALARDKGEEEVLSNIALGYLNSGVSALDMAGYYQVFANGGIYTEPYMVVSIEDEDGVIFKAEPESRSVLDEETASIMTKILEGVLYPGSTGEDACFDGVEIAGKSGTSDNYKDNWFVGFTPEYVCSVWHSNDGKLKNSAAATFNLIMKDMPFEIKKFSISDNILKKTYCKKSGMLKNKSCEDVATGYYTEENLPDICNTCK